MPEPERRWSLHVVHALFILSAGAAVAVAAIGLAPEEILKRFGEFVRRADDVTPERISRLRQAAAILLLAFGTIAVLLQTQRRLARRVLEDAAREVAQLPRDAARWWSSLPVSNRIASLLIFATGAAMRLKYLNTPMAYDEAYSFTNFARRPLVEALADYNNTNNHLLNTFFMHVMFRLFGQQEWALRLPVFFAGIALVALTFPGARVRLGAAAALAAMALVAASPLLIDYSANARGYTFLVFFAMLLDGCLLRIALAPPGASRAATWIAAALCVWLGFFAMPTFVHPLAGLLGWFLLVRGPARTQRSLALIACLAGAGIAVACTYAPAYVFRGTLALRNDFVQPLPLAQWAAEFPVAVWDGVERWVAGGVPAPIIIVLAWGGVVAWVRRGMDDPASRRWGAIAITSMLLVPLALLSLQRVAPPPRLFFFQAPWFYLLVATGAGYAIGLLQRLRAPIPGDSTMRFAAYAALAAGVWFCFEHPILREPHQREFGVGSVPTALQRVAVLIQADPGPVRLYAPLPCDHPAIFYASKFGAAVEINDSPRPGERLLLLARPGDKPVTTLEDVVVRQEGLSARPLGWRIVAEFPELTLWEASQRFGDSNTMGPAHPRLEKINDAYVRTRFGVAPRDDRRARRQ